MNGISETVALKQPSETKPSQVIKIGDDYWVCEKQTEQDIDFTQANIIQLEDTKNKTLQDLVRSYQELQKADHIFRQVNTGILLEDILDSVYENFREILPYNRVGFSLVVNNGCAVQACWARSDQDDVKLEIGYEAPLKGSSLETVLETGQPRIINDLQIYLQQKPESESTQLIMGEGIRSSLTCPLIVDGVSVGFLFFSSVEPNTYQSAHLQSYLRIADHLARSLEKGRMTSTLLEQKLTIEHQNAELQELNTLKNRFLGIAAHDLRNPISYIMMSSKFMAQSRRKIPVEKQDRTLNGMYEQSQYMLTLLDDLLDVATIEAGQLTLSLGTINPNEFLQTAVERHSQLASPKETTITLEGVPEGCWQGDETRLRQVIDNLLSNAVKYSPPGSTIRVDAFREKTNWRVCVHDQGPGIIPEERDRLFKDFGRLSTQPTGGESSTGLGLAISRRIVEAHGGQIGVESEQEQGSTFWFTLPFKIGESASPDRQSIYE